MTKKIHPQSIVVPPFFISADNEKEFLEWLKLVSAT